MSKTIKNNLHICPICGEEMHVYEYGYDNNVYGKIYFKCDCCGHKESKIL